MLRPQWHRHWHQQTHIWQLGIIEKKIKSRNERRIQDYEGTHLAKQFSKQDKCNCAWISTHFHLRKWLTWARKIVSQAGESNKAKQRTETEQHRNSVEFFFFASIIKQFMLKRFLLIGQESGNNALLILLFLALSSSWNRERERASFCCSLHS